MREGTHVDARAVGAVDDQIIDHGGFPGSHHAREGQVFDRVWIAGSIEDAVGGWRILNLTRLVRADAEDRLKGGVGVRRLPAGKPGAISTG